VRGYGVMGWWRWWRSRF